MAGKVKKAIDDLLKQVAKNDPVLIKTTKTKLILKGINPDKFTVGSDDDPVVLQKLAVVAKEFNVKITI